jgi:hypothetical protein
MVEYGNFIEKALDDSWKTLIKSKDDIISIISQKLFEKILSIEPTFKIDLYELRNFTKNKLTDIFEIRTDDFDVSTINIKKNKKKHPSSKRIKISVTFPDKTVIRHRIVTDTFVDTIERIGPEKIIPLNLSRSGVDLISKRKNDFYQQREIGKYLIMVTTSKADKLSFLNEINNKLNLNLIIETF